MSMGNKRFTRSSSNKMIGGVCAGIANYFGWDVSIVRVVYTLASIFTAFSGAIVYIILCIIIPEN